MSAETTQLQAVDVERDVLGTWPMQMSNNFPRHRWATGGTTSADVDGDSGCTASHATTHLADFVVQDDGSPFLSHVQESPESVAKKGFVFPKKREGGGGRKGDTKLGCKCEP